VRAFEGLPEFEASRHPGVPPCAGAQVPFLS
jgi:hypothetical protein